MLRTSINTPQTISDFKSLYNVLDYQRFSCNIWDDMTENDNIKNIAKRLLLAPAFNGAPDAWIWDTALRIETNVNHICQSAEVQQANLAIDLFCLKAATYFFQAGLTKNASLNAALDSAEITRLSTLVVTEALSKVIDAQRIEKINNIITQAADKATRLNEAKILSDAINLDDVGAVGVFNQVRASALQKKSISELINSHRKKADYGYWQARLNEGFHFKNIEKLANKRFAIMAAFMQNLEKETSG